MARATVKGSVCPMVAPAKTSNAPKSLARLVNLPLLTTRTTTTGGGKERRRGGKEEEGEGEGERGEGSGSGYCCV